MTLTTAPSSAPAVSPMLNCLLHFVFIHGASSLYIMHVDRFKPYKDPDELDILPMTLPLDIDYIDAAKADESHDPGLHAELSDNPPLEHEVPLHNFISLSTHPFKKALLWPGT